MKRSEMIKQLQKYFGESEDIVDLSDEIVDFLVSQGMQPPACTIEKPLTPNMPIYDRHGKVTYKVQVNEWEPEITQQKIDEALEHIGRKGVRDEMEITE